MSGPSLLRTRQSDGRERQLRQLATRDIVEAGHGEIIRHGEADLSGRRDGAERLSVARRKNRVRPVCGCAPQQRRRQIARLLFVVERRLHHRCRLRCHPRPKRERVGSRSAELRPLRKSPPQSASARPVHDANYLALVKVAASRIWLRFMSR